METFSIMSDTTYFGNGKSHVTEVCSENSKTLCGVSLGFRYECLPVNDFEAYGRTKNEILYNTEISICKRCQKALKNINVSD